MPKRVKVIHLWARTRIVQRMLMFGMVLWIGGIIYSIGVVQFAQVINMSILFKLLQVTLFLLKST